MKNLPFPLVFFSIYPILFLYSNNSGEVYLIDTFAPLIISVLSTLGLFALLTRIFRDRTKAQLITLGALLVFYSYGHVVDFLAKNKLFDTNLTFGVIILALVCIGIVSLSVFVFRKSKVKGKKIPEYITIVSVILTVFLLYSLITRASSIRVYQKQVAVETEISPPAGDQDFPDIYYIIPDRYANDLVLREDYDFDNSEFIDFLKERGFFVSHTSFANYPKTHLSMASSLNMTYLDDLAEKIGKDSEDKKPVFDMVENNFAQQYLREKGYRFLYMGGWWGPMQQNRYAEENYNLFGQGSDFVRQLSYTTLLRVISDTPIARHMPSIASGDQMKRENLKYQFEKLQELAGEDGGRPKFVIAHLFTPHYPYIFDSACGPKKYTQNTDEDGQYLQQLQCTNIYLMETIEGILQSSRRPPVIVLQSDEGPFLYEEMHRNGDNNVDWTTVSDRAIRHHMMILNAIYLPPEAGEHDTGVSPNLYEGISPVNTLPVLFNRYFGENYPLLPDKAYFIPHLDKSYEYFEVTDRVKK